MVNYRNSFLSCGKAGGTRGGDRLPWVGDNFDRLTSLAWQVHIYGAAAPGMRAWCEGNGLPLHVFPWRSDMRNAGLMRDAVYLVRPDGYVALADAAASTTAIEDYFNRRKIKAIARESNA
jgi:hypothetical protein